MYTVSLDLRVEEGKPGVDEDPDIMKRALREMMAEGKPQRAVVPVHYSTGEDEPPRWLGAFVLTAGHKLLFFPPDMTNINMELRDQGNVSNRRQMPIDHITLNPDWEDGHLTTPPPRQHQRGLRTTPHGDEAYLWFGMSLADDSLLRVVREITKVEAEIDEKDLPDAERRGEILNDALESANVLAVNIREEMKQAYKGYPHFTVMVGRPGFDMVENEFNLVLPPHAGSEEFRYGLEDHFPPVGHRLTLAEDCAVQINTTWVPETLDSDCEIYVGGPQPEDALKRYLEQPDEES